MPRIAPTGAFESNAYTLKKTRSTTINNEAGKTAKNKTMLKVNGFPIHTFTAYQAISDVNT
jgi:hypothetical protein